MDTEYGLVGKKRNINWDLGILSDAGSWQWLGNLKHFSFLDIGGVRIVMIGLQPTSGFHQVESCTLAGTCRLEGSWVEPVLKFPQ